MYQYHNKMASIFININSIEYIEFNLTPAYLRDIYLNKFAWIYFDRPGRIELG